MMVVKYKMLPMHTSRDFFFLKNIEYYFEFLRQQVNQFKNWTREKTCLEKKKLTHQTCNMRHGIHALHHCPETPCVLGEKEKEIISINQCCDLPRKLCLILPCLIRRDNFGPPKAGWSVLKLASFRTFDNFLE